MRTSETFTTGSSRGYVSVKNRGVESEIRPIPESLKGLRGNYRWAMEYFKNKGLTHYTMTCYQGVPGKGYSNQYYYTVYKGYMGMEGEQ